MPVNVLPNVYVLSSNSSKVDFAFWVQENKCQLITEVNKTHLSPPKLIERIFWSGTTVITSVNLCFSSVAEGAGRLVQHDKPYWHRSAARQLPKMYAKPQSCTAGICAVVEHCWFMELLSVGQIRPLAESISKGCPIKDHTFLIRQSRQRSVVVLGFHPTSWCLGQINVFVL